MSNLDNPRAVAGDNRAQAAAENVTKYLESDYRGLVDEIEALLAKAASAPQQVFDDDQAIAVGSIIKLLREADARAEAYRESEKAPHRLSADAVDAFFFKLRERLARRKRTDRPGAIDRLQAAIDSYQDAKRQAEEHRRREEARKAEAEARRKAQEEAEARRRQEEALAAAARARKPENVAARQSEADAAAAAAVAAQTAADIAKAAAQDAHIAAQAKPADLVRTRGEGVTLTQAREGYCVLTDRRLIDAATAAALMPYFTAAEIEKAARGYAKATNHAVQLPGFEIGFRYKGVTR